MTAGKTVAFKIYTATKSYNMESFEDSGIHEVQGQHAGATHNPRLEDIIRLETGLRNDNDQRAADFLEDYTRELSLEDYVAVIECDGGNASEGKSDNLARLTLDFDPKTYVHASRYKKKTGVLPINVKRNGWMPSIQNCILSMKGNDKSCWILRGGIGMGLDHKDKSMGRLCDDIQFKLKSLIVTYDCNIIGWTPQFMITPRDIYAMIKRKELWRWSLYEMFNFLGAGGIYPKYQVLRDPKATLPFVESYDGQKFLDYNWSVVSSYAMDATPIRVGPYGWLVFDDVTQVAWRIGLSIGNYSAGAPLIGNIYVYIIDQEGNRTREAINDIVYVGWIDGLQADVETTLYYFGPATEDPITDYYAMEVSFVPAPQQQGIIYAQVSLEVGRHLDSTNIQDVRVVQNDTPLWVSQYKPDVVPTVVVKQRQDKAVVLVQKMGPDHDPTFTAVTQCNGKNVYARGTSKKEIFASLVTQIRTVYPGTQITWNEVSDVKAWEQAVHNKMMHTLNGNTFMLDPDVISKVEKILVTPGLGMEEPQAEKTFKLEEKNVGESEKQENFERPTGQRIPGKMPLPKFGKIETVTDNAKKEEITEIFNEVSGQELTWPELYDILSGRIGDISFRVQGYMAVLYLFITEAGYENGMEDMLNRVCELGSGIDEAEPDEKELTPEVPKQENKNGRKPTQWRPADGQQNRDGKRPTRDMFDASKKGDKPKTRTELRNQRDNVLRRVASNIPYGWEAVTYLPRSSHSLSFKKAVWENANIDPDVRVAGRLYLNNAPTTVYYDILQCNRVKSLLRGFQTLPQVEAELWRRRDIPAEQVAAVRAQDVAKHNSEMHSLNGNIVIGITRKAWNRLMHSINGNTTFEKLSSLPDVKSLIKSTDGGSDVDIIEFLSRFTNLPGINFANLYNARTALTVRANTITAANAVAATEFQIPIYSLTWNNSVGGAQALIQSGPLIAMRCMATSLGGMYEPTAIGKEISQAVVNNNMSLTKADARSFNGFYISDLVGLMQIKPLYDLSLEPMLLKWLALYDWLSYYGRNTNTLPRDWDPYVAAVDPDFQIQTGLNVSVNAQYNSVVGGLPVFPNQNAAGGVGFHITVNTIVPGSNYWVFPPGLIGGYNDDKMLAIFIALIVDFPFSQFFVGADVGAVLQAFFHPASRLHVPGPQTIQILMPSKVSSRPPQAGPDANLNVVFLPKTGPTAIPGGLGANVPRQINFIGGAPIQTNLCEYLHTWFTPANDSITAIDMILFLAKLSSICPISKALNTVLPVWSFCSVHTTNMARVPPGAGAPAAPVVAAGSYSEVNWTCRERRIYNSANPNFLFGDAVNQIVPEVFITATDPHSWNGIASGLYTAGPADLMMEKLPYGLGTEWFLWYKYADFINHGIAYQLFWRQFGMTAGELALILIPNSLSIYRNDVLAFMQGGELRGRKMARCEASATLEALMINATGYKPYQMNNGLNNLSVFDRIGWNQRPWARCWTAAGALGDLTIPAVFCDHIVFFLCRILEYCSGCIYENGPGTFGFGLPHSFQAAGVYLPLMSNEVGVGIDPINTRVIWDGKTIWNNKLRRMAQYAGIFVGAFRRYLPSQIGSFNALDIPFHWDVAFFDPVLTGGYNCDSFNNNQGHFAFAYSVIAAENILARQWELHKVGANLPCWRFVDGELPAIDYRLPSMALVSKLLAPKTMLVKDGTPEAKDPALAEVGKKEN